ncbi:MAG: hypothetical protein U0Z44_13730 [Kouleothrix sp.]
MSIFDGKRLSQATFKLDAERMRAGWYSDKYFENIVGMLSILAQRGYGFSGYSSRLAAAGIDPSALDIGNLEVEMQWFTRRSPFSLVAGVDKALAMLESCTGYIDQSGTFVNTYAALEVEAVHDGAIVRYAGDPLRVQPVLKVRGRYRDFALIETPTLGALTRATRIATNVYNVLGAARGKPVLFFPARFDAHEVQAADGYAYNIAVQRFNHDNGQDVGSFISTDAQGDWWGGLGGGTVAHAAIAAFLGDTVECILAFAETAAGRDPTHCADRLRQRLRWHNPGGDGCAVRTLPRADDGRPACRGPALCVVWCAPRHQRHTARRMRAAAGAEGSRYGGDAPAGVLPAPGDRRSLAALAAAGRVARACPAVVPRGQDRGHRRVRAAEDPALRRAGRAGRYLWRRLVAIFEQ